MRSRIGDRLPGYLSGQTAPARPDGASAGVDLRKAAKVSVSKRPTMSGRTFAMYLLADMSGSMAEFIRNGDLDYLVEATLTVVDENNWDADRIVPVVPYASTANGVLELQLGQHQGAGERIRQFGSTNRIGYGTNYADAIEATVQHYRASDDWNRRPAICVLQSDGVDGNPGETARKLTEYSDLPMFWVMVYFGRVDPDGRDEASAMRALDEGTSMAGRRTDNVSVFIAGPQPRLVTPTELYDGLLEGPAQWLAQAPRDGVPLPG